MGNKVLQTLWILLLIGFYLEGIRFNQSLYIFGLLQYLLFSCVFSTTSLIGNISLWIAIALNIVVIVSIVLYGECDLDRLKMDGPFQVGYKEIHTAKFDNAMSVFYPISRDDYDRLISKHNTNWLTLQNHSLKGLIKTVYNGRFEWVLQLFSRFLLCIKMNVVKNGPLSDVFTIGGQSLIPVIYSHGLGGNRTMNSGVCRDFASHGYIVFAIDHHDGSCSVYQDIYGYQYYEKNELFDYKLRKNQINIRESEIIALIDELEHQQTPLITQKLFFPPSVKFDLSKLTIGGHSFGGMTAISVANKDKRISACLTLDPWLYVYHTDILAQTFKLDIPLLSINSTRFHPFLQKTFKSWETLETLFKTNKNRIKENLVVNNTGHLHQCDMAVLIPMELYLGFMLFPHTWNNQMYQAMSKMSLRFMKKIGNMNEEQFEMDHIEKAISRFERDKWYKYYTEINNEDDQDGIDDTQDYIKDKKNN